MRSGQINALRSHISKNTISSNMCPREIIKRLNHNINNTDFVRDTSVISDYEEMFYICSYTLYRHFLLNKFTGYKLLVSKYTLIYAT